MTDIIEGALANVYPFVTSAITGAGGYWIVTEVVTNPSSDLAIGIGLVAAFIAFAGIVNGDSDE